MPPVSVIILTYNEEKNIGRCLDSVKDIADDIVVVDSFSTDRTREIVLEKGARFVEHVFEGYIEQKNWAITQAKYPHVLSLDADEALSDTLRESIRVVKNNWEHTGYYFNRLTNYCGKWIHHCGWYPDQKLRLWDSRKGHWGGTNPHDKYILDEGCTQGHLQGDLFHYTFYTIAQHIGQINKFTDISSQAAFKKGKRISILGMILKSKWKFFRDYFLKLGILDGYHGYVICKLGAHSKFVKFIKLYELQENQKKPSAH